MVNIYLNKPTKQLNKFWDGAVFHPTDAIEDDWGQRILNRFSDDNVIKTVRIYTMMEDIVTLDEKGEMQYDFELNDFRLDYLISKGFNIILTYAFLPPWLTVDAEKTSSVAKNKTRYKGKMIVASYAKDYKKWEEICRKYTEHIVERFGIDTVLKWKMQCYNEPNLDFFFMAGEPSFKRRCEEYCKLYDAFEAGVSSVCPQIKIGGPAMAEPEDYGEFLHQFLKHIKNNNKKLDFVSFHTYGTSPDGLNTNQRPLDIKNSLKSINTVLNALKEQGFSNIPVVCDEWGAASHGFYNIEECPGFWFRESEIYAAYFAKMITMYDQMEIPFENLMICLSGQHEMTTDFSGFRNFFTLNFYPKPIYNAHILASKLGDKKLEFDGEYSENLSVLPTYHKDGKVSIMLGYANQNFTDQLEDYKLSLSFKEIKKEYSVNIFVIDKENSNAYNKYCELGKPENPTQEQIAEIKDFAGLKPRNLGKVSENSNQITIDIKCNSLVFVELV